MESFELWSITPEDSIYLVSWQNSFGVITLPFKLGSLSKWPLFSVKSTSQHVTKKEAAITTSWYSIGCPFEIRYAFN